MRFRKCSMRALPCAARKETCSGARDRLSIAVISLKRQGNPVRVAALELPTCALADGIRSIVPAVSIDYVSKHDFIEKPKHCAVELIRSLQRREVTYTGEENKFCIRNTPGKIFGVFLLDKLIMLAVDDRDWHADLRQVVR